MHSVDFRKLFTHPFKPYPSEKISSTDDIAVFVAGEPTKGSLGCARLTPNSMVLSFACTREQKQLEGAYSWIKLHIWPGHLSLCLSFLICKLGIMIQTSQCLKQYNCLYKKSGLLVRGPLWEHHKLTFGTPNIFLGLDLHVLERSWYLIRFSCCWPACSFFFPPALIRNHENESSLIPNHVFSSALVLRASEDPQPQQHPMPQLLDLLLVLLKGTRTLKPTPVQTQVR